MKLIIGLGNPGKEYERTRHNVGFMVVDAYALNAGQNWEWKKSFHAWICRVTKKMVLAKPGTFMNESGRAVQCIMRFYKCSLDDLTVVHDDKDLALGEVRVQKNRGHAGHNGVRSLIDILGSKNFTRVRLGIAPSDPKKMENTSDFVLRKFSREERKIVEEMIGKAVQQMDE